MNKKIYSTYIFPWNLEKSVKKWLCLSGWKDWEIMIFMQYFAKVQNGEIVSLQEFKKILSEQKELQHKNILESFAVGLLFCDLIGFFQENFIEKFAEESRNERKNDVFFQEFYEEVFRENLDDCRDLPKEFLEENPFFQKIHKKVFWNSENV